MQLKQIIISLALCFIAFQAVEAKTRYFMWCGETKSLHATAPSYKCGTSTNWYYFGSDMPAVGGKWAYYNPNSQYIQPFIKCCKAAGKNAYVSHVDWYNYTGISSLAGTIAGILGLAITIAA
ncbi:uncharacterized protein BX664DRAFT_335101 [Halteromyces radiatus]|uniref:uncharacterized protein n=1 Tax=Halteromyces radiatus TaxID=101107 RepID=UPI00222116FC|nr:uncharacterized protein BX664DRAFT_335101 [Halteromyces radiatus]KAI8086178.1 hypothetical protein BX664DRAFT_335101 [Halteromyces radiatus]